MELMSHNENDRKADVFYDNLAHKLTIHQSENVFSVSYPQTCRLVNDKGHEIESPVSIVVQFDANIPTKAHPNDSTTDVAISFQFFKQIRYNSVISIMFRSDWVPVTNEAALSTSMIIFLCVAGLLLFIFGMVTAVLTWRRYRVRRFYLQYA